MRPFLLIFLSVFIFSCTDNKKVIIPDNVLPKDKMAEVLLDIHLLEATLNNNGNPSFANNSITTNSLGAVDVFKKHNISKEQYQESFYFYSNNPKILAEVYSLVLNQLSTLQAQTINKKEK